MFRVVALFSCAAIASGQIPGRPAQVWVETTGAGDLHGVLTIPNAHAPAGLPAAFARALGCDSRGLEKSRYESRISARCPGTHPSALTFHAAVRLAEITPLLRETGAKGIDLVLTAPHFHFLRLDPVVASQESRSGGYYHAQYSLDEAPPEITIDAGFELSQALTLLACAAGLMVTPFLLLLPRPADPLRLRVRTEAIFVLGWIAWIWVLLRLEAGALMSFLCGRWTLPPQLALMPALMAPPLAAVWIGSRLAAVEYARVTPNALGAESYRRARFWSGAAVTCLLSSVLSPLLATSASYMGSLLAGMVLAIACLLRLRGESRGGSHPLSEGDLRKRIFELAGKAGVKLRSVSILTSPSPRPPVAFATRWGAVLLNEGILRSLSRREVDAIVCHELSHLGPLNRSALRVVYALVAASALGAMWLPNFADIVPVLLLAIYFLIKAWRRSGERTADLNAVRWSCDPEAMITGLARVSHAHGMPLEWAAPVSWMTAHPSTMSRLRAIARAGGVSDSRILELLDESRRDPADHYVEAQAAPVPEDAAFSPAMRQRLQTRLTLYSLAAPFLFGLPAVWLLERIGLAWWTVLTVASLCSMLAIYVGAEWIVGSVREQVKRRAIARHGQGVFAGFSPAAEPRVFDGLYHYDIGIVRFADEALAFAGDRACFALDRRMVKRVWLGDGPRHWTPRKVVYIECQPAPEAAPVIFSLQSFEAWLWPWTVAAAKRFDQQVEGWRKVSASSAPPQPCPLPQAPGSPDTSVPFRLAFRSIGIYCGGAFFLTSIGAALDTPGPLWDLTGVLCPAAVCGVLALFMVWPRLRWRRPERL